MSDAVIFPYVAGDALPRIFGKTDVGDITGYAVELNIKRPDGSVLVKTGTIDDAPNGSFSFPAFDATDLQAGQQRATIRIINGASELDSETFYFDVQQKVL